MTDEEIGDLLCAAYDAKPPDWVRGADDDVNTRHTPRVRKHWQWVAATLRYRLQSQQREATAATILAALADRDDVPEFHRDGEVDLDGYDAMRIRYAVVLADALRTELAKERP